MKKYININRVISFLLILPFVITSLNINFSYASWSDEIIYPLKEVSKLSCRFQNFKELWANCKQKLPILHTSDLKKYIKLNWGYNDYTRFYTTLWGASYKYWWDVWFWWHEWIDIATAKWTPVYSIAKWTVVVAKRELGWGSVVSIEHIIRWKKVFSNYAHMSKILVKKWQKVNAWTKIWEVGSEWNSTWNHLHFQIDLDTLFHPFYYSRKTCPYSYSDITEKWVCFNELAAHTLDPLKFLETKGAILDSIKNTNVKVSRSNFNTTSNYKAPKATSFMDIFNRTVYVWYSKDDIKKVQEVFKRIWYYKWVIDWNYSHIENDVIKYQLDKWVINSKTENWAGWFGPKTRAQAKKDYLKIINKIWLVNTSISKKIVNNTNTTQKIERKNILTRAEIEKRELDDFLRKYKIGLSLSNYWWNVNIWWHIILNIEIKEKRNNRYFRWNTPLNVTFPVNNWNIKVFPTKLYNFSDWKRKVQITWIKQWNTRLQVKLWQKILKTFNIKVLKSWQKIYPKSARILWSSRIVYWDIKKWVAVMKDSNNKYLINVKYSSTYTLKWNDDALVCLKSWSFNNIWKIFKSNCKQSDFKRSISFDYSKTVWWLVLFEYKVTWSHPKIQLLNNYKNIWLATKNIYVTNPKDIKANYVYHNSVIAMLKDNIATWVRKWYFMANRDLTNQDAIVWIRNTLIKLKNDSVDLDMINKIDSNLEKLKQERLIKYKPITRKDFIELTYKYLNFNNFKWYTPKNFRDISADLNKKVWFIFRNNVTWKDKYWAKYFRPESHINRWEATFVLSEIYNHNKNYFLTLR